MIQENASDHARQLNRTPRGRLITGGVIFIVGFASPAFIPLVLSSGLPDWLIAGLFGNAQVQAFSNVVRPDYGADWSLRLQLQFLFPK
jgi:hypothetical protein